MDIIYMMKDKIDWNTINKMYKYLGVHPIGWFKVKRSENAKVGVKLPTDLSVESHNVNTCGENNTQELKQY